MPVRRSEPIISGDRPTRAEPCRDNHNGESDFGGWDSEADAAAAAGSLRPRALGPLGTARVTASGPA
jgi:hypothetical protein